MVTRRHPIDQTDELVLYIVKNLTKGVPHLLVESGGVLTTMLAKLLFLVDVWRMQISGSQATDLRYIRYKYGPYPLAQLDERLEKLGSYGLYAIPKVTVLEDKRYRIYRVRDSAKIQLDLSPEVRLLADEVLTTFANRRLDEVLEYVYSLDFVRNVPFGKAIDLTQLKPKDDALSAVLRLFRHEWSSPLPAEHVAALEQASREPSNENIELARAMKEKQRKAFRLKNA